MLELVADDTKDYVIVSGIIDFVGYRIDVVQVD